MLYRSYFSKNNTLIENNRTNNSQNPVTEISYGTVNADVSRFIFDIDLEPLIGRINAGDIKPEQITRHTLRITNTIRFSEDRLGGQFQDFETRRTSAFDLELYNIDEDWDEGNGYDFIYNEQEFPAVPQQASNWFDRRAGIPWAVEGGYSTGQTGVTFVSGTTGISAVTVITGETQVIATQRFEKGNEDVEIDVTDYINQRLFSGNTGFTGTTVISGASFGLGLKFPDDLEALEILERQAVAFHGKKTTTFFEPYIETEYDNAINDDRHNFFLDKDNELYLYAKAGNQATDVVVNSVEIVDYEDVVVATITGTTIENVRTGVYKITLNIDSNTYPDAVLFTDRWNITINGRAKTVEQEFYLISQDNYFTFDRQSRLLSDNYYFKYVGIKEGEKIKRGGNRRVFVETKELYKPNQDNNLPFDIEYKIVSTQNDRFEFDVIPWTKVDRTSAGHEFIIDTSWLIPRDYTIEIRMLDGDISFSKERLTFIVVSDGVSGVQNQ